MEEFENVQCQKCATKKRPLFMMQPPRDSNDVVCPDCKEKVISERTKIVVGNVF